MSVNLGGLEADLKGGAPLRKNKYSTYQFKFSRDRYRYLVPSTWYLVPDTRYLVPDSWNRYLAPGTRYKVTRYLAPKTKVFTAYRAVKEARVYFSQHIVL